jgi:AP-3 complex subunit beta
MTENTGKVTLPEKKNDAKSVVTNVLTVANMLQVASGETDTVYRFAAKTMSEGVLVLVSVSVQGESANIVVNCEKMVIGTMLLKDLKSVLGQS